MKFLRPAARLAAAATLAVSALALSMGTGSLHHTSHDSAPTSISMRDSTW